MTRNLALFRSEFLEANSWEQRKDGTPLYLLDNLSDEEREVAEEMMIKAVGLHDHWPIVGLGHIQSKDALPGLYKLLEKSERVMRVIIAQAIFQIKHDNSMIDIVLDTMPTITKEEELIDVLYYLPKFNDQRITDLHHTYRNHEEYLVAYNATRYLGLSTDEVVEKYRSKVLKSKFVSQPVNMHKRKPTWWEKLFGLQ